MGKEEGVQLSGFGIFDVGEWSSGGVRKSWTGENVINSALKWSYLKTSRILRDRINKSGNYWSI